VIVIISATLNIISKFIGTYITVMISRFLAGVYSGFFTGILPLYLNECSSKNLRGFSGTMNQLAIVLGVVVVNIIGLPDLLGTIDLWPVLVGLTLVPIIFHIVLFFLSESPKYVCINKHDREGAKQSNNPNFL
jgi:MFS family permease